MRKNVIIDALLGSVAMPRFPQFCAEMRKAFEFVREHVAEGEVFSYGNVDELALVDGETFGIRYVLDGDSLCCVLARSRICVRAVCAPLTAKCSTTATGKPIFH